MPLINVVFLLLVFFMIAGRLASSDPFPIAPPHSSSDGPAEARAITVFLGADGTLALDGERMDASALGTAVAAQVAESPFGLAGAAAPPLVHMKADAAVAAVWLVEILEILRQAGI